MHGHRRKPRVAHVITRMIRGGAQENTMALVGGLRRDDRFDTVLLTGPTYGDEGSVLPEAAAQGVYPHVVPLLLRHLNPVLDPFALVHLWWVLRRGEFDVVHTHSSKAGILGRLAARLAGCRTVVHTAHGWAFSVGTNRARKGFYAWIERVCARACDAIVVVTTVDADAGLARRIGRPEMYHVIRSGIDLSRFATASTPASVMRERWDIPAGAPVVGSVMRLSEQKAPLDWVRTAAKVSAAMPDTIFVVVGDGPLRNAVEAEAAALGIAERLRIVGIREDVPDFLALFDVFLLTSRWEGLPRVLPQAMSAGVPIVATAVDGSVEAVCDGENGFLAPAKDIPRLADRVIHLLRNPDVAQRCGERGRALAEEFDEDRMIERTGDLYDTLLDGEGRRA